MFLLLLSSVYIISDTDMTAWNTGHAKCLNKCWIIELSIDKQFELAPGFLRTMNQEMSIHVHLKKGCHSRKQQATTQDCENLHV